MKNTKIGLSQFCENALQLHFKNTKTETMTAWYKNKKIMSLFDRPILKKIEYFFDKPLFFTFLIVSSDNRVKRRFY